VPVVDDDEVERAVPLFERDRPPVRLRVLRSVLEGFQHGEVDGRLDLLRESAEVLGVDSDGHRRFPGLGLERRREPLVGEERWVDAAREVAQVVEGGGRVDLQLAEGRSLDVITQAETLAPYGSKIGTDYERYTAGTVMLETAERLVVEDKEPALQQFLLLVGGLRTMASGERSPSAVLDSFLLRSLSVAGWAPSFDACARCGLEGPHRSFSPAAGGMLCGTCRVPGSASPAAETVVLLGALLSGDWAVVEASEPRHRKEATGLVSAYLAWHLERGLKSLSHVER